MSTYRRTWARWRDRNTWTGLKDTYETLCPILHLPIPTSREHARHLGNCPECLDGAGCERWPQ